MEPKNLVSLNLFDVSKSDVALKVRVIKRWETPSYKDQNDYFSIELIVIDEENTRRQCTVQKRFAQVSDKLLHENIPLYIVRPTLAENKSKYKHINTAYMIAFNKNTTVRICTTFDQNPYGFVFASFEDILQKKIEHTDLIDVMGSIIKVFERTTFKLPCGSGRFRRNVKIIDLEFNEIYITIWGDYCVQLEKFIEEHPDDVNVVVILQFGKVGFFNEEPFVSNSFNASRVFIDADIDEINNFKNSLKSKFDDTGSKSELSLSNSLVPQAATLEVEFPEKHQFCTIADLSLITEPKYVIVLGTIQGIDKQTSWNYDGCNKCNSKVKDSSDGSGIECKNADCNKHQVVMIKKFKIPLRVQDETGTITCTMFDKDSRKFIDISVSDLLKNDDDFDEGEFVPKRFNCFIGKKMAFKIPVKAYNINSGGDNYSISRFTEDDAILEALDKKFVDAQDKLNDVDDCLDVEKCEPTLSAKDVVSSIGDNATPKSMGLKIDGKKVEVDEVANKEDGVIKGLKRNLENVYKIGDNACSSSKSEKKKNEVVVPIEEVVIPKLEK